MKTIEQIEKAKEITILLTSGSVNFNGWYIGECGTNNWHYYQDDEGMIYHFRKEHIHGVIEKEISDEED